MRDLTPTELREIADYHAAIGILRHQRACMMEFAGNRGSRSLEALSELYDEMIRDLHSDIAMIESRPADEVSDETAWVTDTQLRFELGAVA